MITVKDSKITKKDIWKSIKTTLIKGNILVLCMSSELMRPFS
jgi:hypothetical protein